MLGIYFVVDKKIQLYNTITILAGSSALGVTGSGLSLMDKTTSPITEHML